MGITVELLCSLFPCMTLFPLQSYGICHPVVMEEQRWYEPDLETGKRRKDISPDVAANVLHIGK